MKKHTNPFLALNEATDVLKYLGVDPFNPNTEAPGELVWQEHILSINVHTDYTNLSHYFVCQVHLENEGFDALMKALDHKYSVCVQPFVEEFEEHFIEPSEHLRIFKLVDKHKKEGA